MNCLIRLVPSLYCHVYPSVICIILINKTRSFDDLKADEHKCNTSWDLRQNPVEHEILAGNQQCECIVINAK